MITKIIFIAGAVISLASFCHADDKAELAAYIKEASIIIANADMAVRDVGPNPLLAKDAARRINVYINQMKLVKYPEAVSRQRSMILLSFKKIRAGLILLSPEKKDKAVGLVRGGARLLKYAAGDMLALAEKEGLRK